MLLMVPPATATVSGDSFSSPSSAESNFRQLDDVFLQTQTRIWLGEVLHTRFDEQLDISDLLSDGELLCDVSKMLWNMLLVKFVEPRHVKTNIPNDSRKSSGRYMPYSNVDSFLKVCKVFGLDGIDLFSPSDVVEKRDTRKVCICIRSLSKKARSKQLNVPDFDIVTYTVAMPTDIVGCIRKSLELSQQLAFSDPIAFHANISHPIQLDEDSMSSSFMDNESYGSNSTPDTSKYEGLSSYPDNSDDGEVSSKISMSSLLSGRVLQFDFDANRDEDNPRTTKLFRTEFPYYEAESMENRTAEFCKVQDVSKYERPLHCTILDTEESHTGLELESCDLSVESHLPFRNEKSLYSSMREGVELVDNRLDLTKRDSVDALWVKNKNLIVAANDLELEGEVGDDDKVVVRARLVNSDPDIKELAVIHFPEDCCNNHVERTSKDSNCKCNCAFSTLQVQYTTSQDVCIGGCQRPEIDDVANQCECCDTCSNDMDRTCHQAFPEDGSRDLLHSHAQQTNEVGTKGNLLGPLLKTVAKGTAFIGLVFLLHLRIRNDRERKGKGGEQSSTEKKDEGDENSNKDEGGEKSSPVQKKLSSQNGRRGTSEVYPAHKLKLGN